MKKITSLTLLFVITIITSYAQSFYKSRNYLDALKSDTRSNKGVPGNKYWQNTSSYNIKANIHPREGNIDAHQTIKYINNSPNSIKKILFNVYQNLYKKGVARRIDVNIDDLHDGVNINGIKIDNIIVDNKNIKNKGTLMTITLETPLSSGDSISIDMNWSLRIPQKSKIRMSKYSDDSMFIGKWFPKIAVYDDIEGWNSYPHNGLAEFYNDFSQYDISINVPENYIVVATGELNNAESVLQTQIYKRLNRAKQTDDNVIIVSNNDKIVTKKGNQTWIFTASNVPDFAFGIARNYIWEGSSIQAKGLNNRVFVDALYNPESKDFKDVVDYAKATVKYISAEEPSYPFPYTHMTTFDGHGGMEYPMITNNGSEKEKDKTVYVTTHEIMHTIFPMLVGISETKYGWFDEGFTVVLPESLQDKLEAKANPTIKTVRILEKYYSNTERSTVLMTPTHYLDANIYFIQNYGTSEFAIRLLKDYFGRYAFNNILCSFIDAWKYKHPTPYDFFAFVNDYTKTNLDWYWNKWFFEYAKTDLSISKVQKSNGSLSIYIDNIGGLPLPVSLNVEFSDGSSERLDYKIDVWKDGNKSIEINHTFNKTVKKISLGNDLIPDIDKSNNEYSM